MFNVIGLIGDSLYSLTVKGKDINGNILITSLPLAAKTLGGYSTGTKQTQTITFGSLSAKTVIDLPFALTASSSSKLPITYTSSNTSVATVTGNIVKIVGPGTTNITASQIGNATINAATDVKQLLTVTKLTQKITFAALPVKTTLSIPFALTATSNSLLHVTYTSSDTSVATVYDTTVIIHKAGTTIITASQTGNNIYNPAVDVKQTLTVNKLSQTITFAALPVKTTADAAFALTATSNSLLHVTYTSSDTSVATISDTTVTILKVGTTIITATQSGNDIYAAAVNIIQKLTVIAPAVPTYKNGKLNQTITFAALAAKTVVDKPFALTATSSSHLPITYTTVAVAPTTDPDAVATINSNGVVIIHGAGTINIIASQAGNSNVNAAISVTQKLTVNRLSQTISFGVLAAKTIVDNPFALTATASSGLPIIYSVDNPGVATILGNIVIIVGVGTANITATQVGNNLYNAATNVLQKLTVSKLSQTISFAAFPTKMLGDDSIALAATSNSLLHVTYRSSNTSVATINDSTLTIVGIGTDTIYAMQAGNSIYNAATTVYKLLTVKVATPAPVVVKGIQTITFGTLPVKTIVDESFPLLATTTSGLPILYSSSNPSVATVLGNIVTIVGTGVTNITALQSGNIHYLSATPIVQKLTVNKLSQTISFALLPAKTIVDAPFQLTAKSTSLLPITYTIDNPSVATISGNIVTIVDVGTANITASQAGNNTYNAATNIVQKLTVNKLSQTITFAALATYTTADVPFPLTATSSSFLPISYVSSNPDVANVDSNGVVTIYASGTTTITAMQVGNSLFNAALNVMQKLTVNTPSTPTMTGGKTNQIITFGVLAAKTTADVPFLLIAKSTSLLPISYSCDNIAVATISGNIITIVGSGTANITASQSGNNFYNAAKNVVQKLTVNKKSQTITFAALATYSIADIPFPLTATSSSLLPVSYTSSNPDVATVSDNIVTIIGVGTTNITASQAGNNQYNAATSVVQKLTVSKLPQIITFGTFPVKTLVDVPFPLLATTTSGLPITYSSSDTNVATIFGNIITIVGAGTANITASQSGNSQYLSAISVTQKIIVNKLNQVIKVSASGANIRGQINLTTTINSGLPVAYTNSDPTTASFDATTGIVTFLQSGSVTITASQAGNDLYSAAVSVSVLVSYSGALPPSATFINTSTGITDVSNNGINVSVYPNPATSYIYVEVSEKSTIQIINMNGQKIFSEININANQKQELNIQNFATGIYIIRIFNDKFSTVKKVIINK